MRGELKRPCRLCRTRLLWRQVRCPYCRQSAMNWLHRSVITAFAATAAFYVLKALY